jgi:ribosomal protein L24E
MEPSFYKENKEENVNLEIPVSHTDFMRAIESYFNDKLKNSQAKVKNVLAGMEFGDDNGKCHFQCIVDFTCNARIQREPGSIFVNEHKILIMFQETKNHSKLVKYCKKQKHYKWLREHELVFKKNSKGEETLKLDAFSTIYSNRDTMSKTEASELLFNHEARTYFTSYKNIESALSNILATPLPEFEWNFPEHLDKTRYSMIYNWFVTYCIGNPTRKKALLLYSKERAFGKTRFAKSLVNHEDYAVCFRNTFSNVKLNTTPRLLILDDMNYTGGGDKTEIWKALVAGEKTTIRDAYVHYEWEHEIPCIITTNNEGLFIFMANSPVFKTQVLLYEVREYMGPPGTRPEDLTKVEIDASDILLEKINAKAQEKDKPNNEKFDLKGFVERAKLVQKVADLEAEIEKKNKKPRII